MRRVALGEVSIIDRKVVDPADVPPATAYIGLEHIERGGRIIGSATVDSAELASAKFTFTPEHVLYGKLRPNLGKIARPTVAGVCSTDILAIRPGSDLDRDYLTHYLRQPAVVAQAAARASGANLPRLSANELAAFALPLPAITEQRRIAAILDRADALRAKRQDVLHRLESLPGAVFRERFGSPNEWSKRWSLGAIGDLARSVDYGTSSKAGSLGSWPILRMGNVTDDGRLDLGDLKFADLSDSEVIKYGVRRGDMLFNRTNSREKVGKSAVVRTDRPLAIAGYLIRVRFDEAATAEFVSAYLTSAHGLAVRRKLAKAAVNQANINATEMRGIVVPIPPLEERRSFARAVMGIEEAREAAQRALAVDDELFESLQARAFRGEL